MYNQYLDQGDDFQPVEPTPSGQAKQNASSAHSAGLLRDLFSRLGRRGDGGGLSGLFQGFHLDDLDKGDILLILILLYLSWESEDDEWLIILGLLLFTDFLSP